MLILSSIGIPFPGTSMDHACSKHGVAQLDNSKYLSWDPLTVVAVVRTGCAEDVDGWRGLEHA